MTFRVKIQFPSWGHWHWPHTRTHTHTHTHPLLSNVLAVAWFWSAAPLNYKTQESRRPSCESIVLIVGANLRATALPEAHGVIRTSTVVVTYLVTNSVWHEARWEMGRKKQSVNRPLKCIPEPIHLTAKEEEEEEEEEEDRQKECDDTVWRMYVQ